MVCVFTSCDLSTNDLTKKVKSNMEEKFEGQGIKIKSLVVTKKQGNEYSGVLETSEPNGDFTYSVEIISDGNSFTWKVLN